jgi:hypothetical protein
VTTPFSRYLAGRIVLEDFGFLSEVPLEGSLRFDLRGGGQRWIALTRAASVVELDGLLPKEVLSSNEYDLRITFEPTGSSSFSTSRCEREGALCRVE